MNDFKYVIRDVLKTASVGIALGLIGAFLAGSVLQNQLFGVTTRDTITYLVTAITIVVVATLAGWLPARIAANIDPMVALLSE